jgi:hypothetical protein
MFLIKLNELLDIIHYIIISIHFNIFSKVRKKYLTCKRSVRY